MPDLMKNISLACAIIMLFFTGKAEAGNIKSFHVQLELTPEAKSYVESLSEDKKSNWLNTIPDSIPLKATCVLELENTPTTSVGFKLGSIDGLGDIYDGQFNFVGSNNIVLNSSGNIYYFELGSIKNYQSFVALLWISNTAGAPVEMVRFEKK